MMWWHGDLNGWEWLAMSASMFVFWGLVLWGVLSVVRGASKPDGHPPDAEELLRQRFARGDIDPDEFERRQELLRR